MRFNQVRGTLPRALLAGLSSLAFALPAVQAQQPATDAPATAVASGHLWGSSCPKPCPPDCAPAPITQPSTGQPPTFTSPDATSALMAPSLTPGLSAGVGGEQFALSNVGYI